MTLMKRFVIPSALLAVAIAFGASSTAQEPGKESKPFPPVSDEMLWKPSPSDWLSWRRTLDSHGFSPLKQVNRNNVNQLKMVWTRPIGTGNQESTPLAYNGMLYIPNSGDHIMAVDAKSRSEEHTSELQSQSNIVCRL